MHVTNNEQLYIVCCPYFFLSMLLYITLTCSYVFDIHIFIILSLRLNVEPVSFVQFDLCCLYNFDSFLFCLIFKLSLPLCLISQFKLYFQTHKKLNHFV